MSDVATKPRRDPAAAGEAGAQTDPRPSPGPVDASEARRVEAGSMRGREA